MEERGERACARGHVYCLSVDTDPTVVKIGATTRDPYERVREANACTWSLSRFALVAAVEVTDVWATERLFHKLLAARLVTDRREFFALSPEDAAHVFRALAPEGAAPLPTPAPSATRIVRPHTPVQPHHDEPSLLHQAIVAQTPEAKLRAWVEERYVHVPLKEKDTGTKLEALYTAYTTSTPPVHAKLLGKILFAKMLNAVFPNVGPHRNTASTAWNYLLR